MDIIGYVISTGDIGTIAYSLFVEADADLVAAVNRFWNETGCDEDMLTVNPVLKPLSFVLTLSE